MAFGLLASMFSWKPGVHMLACETLAALLLIAGAIAHFGPNTFELRHNWRPLPTFGLGVLLVVCIIFIYGGQQSPFLYFQF
jgi:hypothetical protein